jgi:hypothetical protein
LHLTISLHDGRTCTEQPEGSNSIAQLLSVVNWRTEIRFIIICGDTRTLLRQKLGDNSAEPMTVTGTVEPLPKTIEEGVGYCGKEKCERVED